MEGHVGTRSKAWEGEWIHADPWRRATVATSRNRTKCMERFKASLRRHTPRRGGGAREKGTHRRKQHLELHRVERYVSSDHERREARSWERKCKQYAQEWGMPLERHRANINQACKPKIHPHSIRACKHVS